jgi:hypothetical protein
MRRWVNESAIRTDREEHIITKTTIMIPIPINLAGKHNNPTRQTDERRKTQPRHRLTRYETHERLVHLISLPSALIRIRDDPVRQLVLVGE